MALCCVLRHNKNFNPRSPHGERPKMVCPAAINFVFQPTLPARGATGAVLQRNLPRLISTHAPRTGSDPSSSQCRERRPRISTHAPRTGSDPQNQAAGLRLGNFNPRSPHGERPLGAPALAARLMDFNPRSPHGERLGKSCRLIINNDFNPRSPHGERPLLLPFHVLQWHFNPRSPHGERPRGTFTADFFVEFQPTLPARGATLRQSITVTIAVISTHAPRTGSDSGRTCHRAER